MIKPHVIRSETEIENYPPCPFPVVGPFAPDGWVLERKFMVDSHGFGRAGEGAYTMDQFKGMLQVGKAYGIIEQKEFQALVGQYDLSPTIISNNQTNMMR